MEEEKKFQHNLRELAGLTDAVSVDCILEVLLYIQNHSVSEAVFIKESYLSVVFNSDEFLTTGGIFICSLNAVINKYQEALRNNNGELLRLLRAVHRQAREFLRDGEIKNRIKELIVERKSSMESKAVWNLIIQTIVVVQNFPSNMQSRIFAEILPRITQNLPLLLDSTVSTT